MPASAAAGTSAGCVTVNFAVGNWSVWRPSLRSRSSRRPSSDWMIVVSTVRVPAISCAPSPSPSTVIEPVTRWPPDGGAVPRRHSKILEEA
jgi:hypothetical protein